MLLYLESFGNPQKFARVAGRVARRKPILALKAGTSHAGARAASSHTAALAGSDAAVEALFRSAGVLRARRPRGARRRRDAAVEPAASERPPRRRADERRRARHPLRRRLRRGGLELPELADETRQALAAILPSEASLANPVDLLGSATGKTYAEALPHVLRDPGIDAVIALFVPPVVAGADEVAAAMREALEREHVGEAGARRRRERRRNAGDPAGADSPVAAFAYPESAARALGFAAGRAEWLRRPAGTVPAIDGIDRAAARRLVDTALAASDDVWLDAAAARTLLTAYGVPLVPEQVAADAAGAVAAADALGRPVVLKTAAAGVHKTESGGVALNLETDDEIRAAAERIGGGPCSCSR